MRKSFEIALVVVLLLAVVPLSRAQMRFGVGPHAGVAFSSFKEPMSEAYGTGLVFGAHADLDLSRFLTVRLAFDYTTFGAKEDKLRGVAAQGAANVVQNWLGRALTAEEAQVVDRSIRSASGARANAPSVALLGLGKIPTGSKLMPYGILGLGVDFLGFSDLTFESTGLTGTDNQGQGVQLVPAGTSTTDLESETKFSLQFGAGSEFRLSSAVKLLFEVKYHMIFTSDGTSSFVPLVLGATFSL